MNFNYQHELHDKVYKALEPEGTDDFSWSLAPFQLPKKRQVPRAKREESFENAEWFWVPTVIVR